MLMFLEANGLTLHYSQNELQDTFLGLANSEITFENLIDWIIAHEEEK